MAAFKDLHGRTWVPRVTVGTVRKIRGALSVDIYKMVGDETSLSNFFGDIVLVVDSLYLACEAQAKEFGVTSEQFGELLAGDVAEQAIDAFQEALLDFFPNAAVRESLRALMAKEKKLRAAMAERGGQVGALQLERLLDVLQSKTPQELASMPKDRLRSLFGNLPESVESIQHPGQPENSPGRQKGG